MIWRKIMSTIHALCFAKVAPRNMEQQVEDVVRTTTHMRRCQLFPSDPDTVADQIMAEFRASHFPDLGPGEPTPLIQWVARAMQRYEMANEISETEAAHG